MKYILTILVALILSNCHLLEKNDQSDIDNLLGLALLNAMQVPQNEVQFDLKYNGQKFECGNTTYSLPKGQVVQLRDFRFFIQEANLIEIDGSKVKIRYSQVDNYQETRDNSAVALMDFSSVDSGACTGTSDNITTNTSLKGFFTNRQYKGIELTLGVPGQLNHINPDIQDRNSPLKNATGMTWSWLFGYKFFRFELTTTGSPSNLQLHLGSTDCSGDTAIPFGEPGARNCIESYRPVFTILPDGGFNPGKDRITIQAEEFFKGNGDLETSEFAAGTALSCMPGTTATCDKLLKSIGLVGGSSSGKGNTNTSTQSSIFKVIR